MNSRTLVESFGYIDPKFVERSERRTASGRVLTRFAAAAAALLLVLGAAFGVVKAAGEKGNAASVLPEKYAFMADTAVPADAVLPPSQTGNGNSIHAEYERSFTIPAAYDESTVVCILTIRDWLGETEGYTYYEATVEHVYKGELPERIVYIFPGNSEGVLGGSPLHTYGDKILVFLDKWNHDGFENSNAYCSIGADISFLYLAISQDNDVYLIDHRGVFSKVTEEECDDIDLRNYASDEELVEQLCTNMSKYNKLLAEDITEYSYVSSHDIDNVPLPLHIYSLAAIEELFSELN